MGLLNKVVDSYKARATKRLLKVRDNFISDLGDRFPWLQINKQIGSLGDIVFTVTTDEVRTFRDYKRSTKARFATHEIIEKSRSSNLLPPTAKKSPLPCSFMSVWA